jgi:hypothetical protein
MLDTANGGWGLSAKLWVDDVLLCQLAPTAVEDGMAGISPSQIAATPNPGTNEVVLRYELLSPQTASLEIFNVSGAVIRRLVAGSQQAGHHTVLWDGRDDAGRDVPSGVYVARIVRRDGIAKGRFVLTR